MAENPLLPHAKLRQLYDLMQQAQPLLRRRGAGNLAAALAPMVMQAELGDRLFASIAPGVLHTLAAAAQGAPLTPSPLLETNDVLVSAVSPLSLALGAAAALQLTRPDPVTFALLDAYHAMPQWQQAIAAAQSGRLPVVLLFVSSIAPSQAAPDKGQITWPALERVAIPLHFPVIPVDARDAVAIYRVVQESSLRARTGGGPAAIWCTDIPGSQRSALTLMKRYLEVRGIEPLQP